MSVTYKKALQVKYTVWFLSAAITFFANDELAKLDLFDYPTGLSGKQASIFKCVSTAFMVSAGAIYAGAAQGSEMARRKVLQYSMLHSVAELICYVQAYGKTADSKIQSGIALTLLDFLFTTLVCYVFNKKSSLPLASPVEGRMKVLTRVLYVLYGLGAASVFMPDMFLELTFTKSPSVALSWAFARIACVKVLMLGALIAAAQSDEESTKKLLQYSVTLPLLKMYFVDPMLGGYTLTQPNGLYIMYGLFKFSALQIFFTLLACYPSSLRSWLIRDTWMFYAWAAIYHYMHPDTVGTIFQYSNFSQNTSYQVACVMAFVSIVNMATKRMDEGFTQLQQERYTLIIDFALPVLALAKGMDFGIVLIGRHVFYGLAKSYDLYCDQKGIDTIFAKDWFAKKSGGDGKSKMVTKAPSSPKSPGGMKKKKA